MWYRIMNTETMLTIFAIVAALGLVTIVAVEALSIAQEAEATRGCPAGTPAANASKGRCFMPGPQEEQQQERQGQEEEEEEEEEQEEEEEG
jgi:hypothetical protein